MEESKKYVEIDLMKYIPLDTRIVLKDNFRYNFFQVIEQRLGKRKISEYLGVSVQTIEGWKTGKWSPKLASILRIAHLIGINEEEVIDNIQGFKSRFNSGLIFPPSLKIILNEEVGEWLGLFEGDGYLSRSYVGLGNTFFNLVFFFLSGLEKWFGVSKRQIQLELRIPIEDDISVAKPIEEVLKLRGFTRIKTVKFEKEKQFLLDSRVSIKILSTLLSSLLKDVQMLIQNSPKDVKRAYISGFASAEASINLYENCRTLNFPQKDPNKLLFIKKLLSELRIENIKGPRPAYRGNFRIDIRARRCLEKFSQEIGFGHHEIKNQKLRETISNYALGTELRQRSKRYSEILKLVKIKGAVNKVIVAKAQKVSKKYANQLLREMEKKNLLKSDKFSKPYNYFLGDVCQS